MVDRSFADGDAAVTLGDDRQTGPQLLDRTFAILGLFSIDHPEWTTTEAASACDLSVATVHRILVALRRHGYLTRDDLTKRYRLGSAALELGRDAAGVDGPAGVEHPRPRVAGRRDG